MLKAGRTDSEAWVDDADSFKPWHVRRDPMQRYGRSISLSNFELKLLPAGPSIEWVGSRNQEVDWQSLAYVEGEPYKHLSALFIRENYLKPGRHWIFEQEGLVHSIAQIEVVPQTGEKRKKKLNCCQERIWNVEQDEEWRRWYWKLSQGRRGGCAGNKPSYLRRLHKAWEGPRAAGAQDCLLLWQGNDQEQLLS